MSLDGGYVYIAGHCGLVPVMAENYGKDRVLFLFLLDHEEERWERHRLIDTMAVIKLSFPDPPLARAMGKSQVGLGSQCQLISCSWTSTFVRLSAL